MTLRALAALLVAVPVGAETLCARVTEHDQFGQLFAESGEMVVDCEKGQWLVGMVPAAHLGPVFPDGPGTPARFMPPPTCTHGGDGFTREENGQLWMHDHIEFRGPLTSAEIEPDYHFQCPEVANPNWSKDGRRTHTYNTSEGLILQGRNGAWCVEEPELGNFCNPDTISGGITHQQHRGPLACEFQIPHTRGSAKVHVGCNWSGCAGENGLTRARVYEADGSETQLGLFESAGSCPGCRVRDVEWEGDQAVLYLDGKRDTTWAGLLEVCVETVPEPATTLGLAAGALLLCLLARCHRPAEVI